MGKESERTPLDARTEAVGKAVVDAAYKVHRTLGPGLLEHVYEICLTIELEKRGLTVKRQLSQPIVYEGVKVLKAYVVDLLVEDLVVVEVKAVEQIHRNHKAQLLTYLKMSGKRLGYLINFHEAVFADGITRKVM